MTEHVTWDEVGRRFGELGRALKAHAPEGTAGTAGTAGAAATEPPEDGADATGSTGSEGVDRALAQVTDALNRLSVSVGEAVEDPTVRDAARTAVRGVGAALSLTLDELAAAIDRSAGRGRAGGSTDDDTPADDTPADDDTPPTA